MIVYPEIILNNPDFKNYQRKRLKYECLNKGTLLAAMICKNIFILDSFTFILSCLEVCGCKQKRLYKIR